MSWRYCSSKSFPKIFTQKSFLFLIHVKRRNFVKLSEEKSFHYKKTKKLKRDGIKYREIYKPDRELKFILKKINRKYLSKFDFPPFVHCGPRGKSIVTAAQGHTEFSHHVSLDIESFFDRVTKKVTEETLIKIGVNKNIVELISGIAIEDNRIPQGFPTSSSLSALVVSFVLQDFCLHFNKGEIIFSLYADDILISSNNESLLKLAEKFIDKQLWSIGLSLNSKKEVGKKGKKFKWLGLQIHPWISLPRKTMVDLQKRVYEYKTNGIIPEDFKPKKRGQIKKQWEQSVKGKIVFAQSVSENKLLEKILKKISDT